MWLACATQDEIVQKVGVPQETVVDWIKGFTETTATGDSVFSNDFTPPIYNIWKQQTKSEGSTHGQGSVVPSNDQSIVRNAAGAIVAN